LRQKLLPSGNLSLLFSRSLTETGAYLFVARK
jgi:hypothetical protein